MDEDVKKRKSENIIGFLLIIPFYLVIIVISLFCAFDINNTANNIIFLFLIYLPIIIGLFLSFKNHKEKASKLLCVLTLIFLAVSLYFYYKVYFVTFYGWDGLTYFVFWLISIAICRLVALIFYIKLVGFRKALLFICNYIIVILVLCIFRMVV